MSVLGKLINKIFGHGDKAAPPVSTPPGASAPAGRASGTAGPVATAPAVDIDKVLSDLAAKNPQKLNWRTSIVDLMKLVGMDSSLTERRELARELNYTGSLEDTAAMNMWLHKQVMRKLAENGGKVPADLLD